MASDIETVLTALNQANVRYLVVGGVAVVLHGHLRTTADLDLIIQLETDNTLRAVDALAQLGYQPRAPVPIEQFADASMRQSWLTEKGMTVLGLWSENFPTLEVDLFIAEPIDFNTAYNRALTVTLDSTTATVVSLDDLISLKRMAARAIDLADIEAMQALKEVNENSNE
ncbi:MAG: nucleotidyltransferase [Deltaproteobacteria bacterium]|nr:nucleotidyltransferase [Deltaproteobacteria bacterium]